MTRKQRAALLNTELRKATAGQVNLSCLGNSDRTTKEVVIDLINASELSHADIALGSFLSTQTVKKLVATRKATRRPQGETLDRILRFFGAEQTIRIVTIKTQFTNKQK